ncbi:MAG: Gfo/Idh/MocA family oxidoreductase [Gammaproteobacteria bacterium]|nr:Gfo/Idh/MocA family oxidoreductase [Gammaproteobacteria bacterium]
MKKVKIAVAGAGLAGRQHITAIAQVEEVALAAVADPDARAFAGLDDGVPRYASLDEMLDAARPDGVIIATPNHLHVAHGLACVAAGVPALIEKPIAADTVSAAPLVAAAEAKRVALLIGHHRRHNPLVAAARRVIADGELGRLLAVHAQTWLIKPDDYFRAAWRKQQGAGPVFINLIHDIDLLRHFCGEMARVRAVSSNAARGHAVEDTAVALLEFVGGALGTLSVSDSVVGPWSWELTARENPAYPATGETCYWLGGSEGALALPNLTLWKNPAERSWWSPMAGTRLVFEFGGHALTRQLQHFASVIRGEVAPLVNARDGLASLAAVEAINHAAESGESVAVDAGPAMEN